MKTTTTTAEVIWADGTKSPVLVYNADKATRSEPAAYAYRYGRLVWLKFSKKLGCFIAL